MNRNIGPIGGFLSIALLCMAASGGDEGQHLPPEATTAKEAYQHAVEQATKDYNDKLDSAKAAYLKRLDSVMSSETRKGNLEGALAVRDEIKSAAMTDPTGLLRVPVGTWHVKWMSGEINYVLGESSADVPSNGGHCRTPTRHGNQMIMLWDNYPTVDRVTYLGHNVLLAELWHDRNSYRQGLPPFLVGLGQLVVDSKGNSIVSVDSRDQWSAPVKLRKGKYTITATGRWTPEGGQVGTVYFGPDGMPGRDGLYGLSFG